MEIDEESETRWVAIHRDTRQVFIVEMCDDPPLAPADCTHWHDQTMPVDRKRVPSSKDDRKRMPEPSLLFAKPKQLNLF